MIAFDARGARRSSPSRVAQTKPHPSQRQYRTPGETSSNVTSRTRSGRWQFEPDCQIADILHARAFSA